MDARHYDMGVGEDWTSCVIGCAPGARTLEQYRRFNGKMTDVDSKTDEAMALLNIVLYSPPINDDHRKRI